MGPPTIGKGAADLLEDPALTDEQVRWFAGNTAKKLNGVPDGPLTDKLLSESAGAAWEYSYARATDDLEATRLIAQYHREWIDELVASLGKRGVPWGGPMDLPERGLVFESMAARWAHCGFPRIVTTHTFAAALMATDARGLDASDLRISWRTFLVAVPDGLLGDIGRLMLDAHGVEGDQGAELYMWNPAKPFGAALRTDTAPLGELLFGDDTSDEPRVRLARRLVRGLLLAMQNRDNFRQLGPRERDQRETEPRTGPPKHRVFFVGRPLRVDCRPAIAAYLRGDKHAPPSVQTLVRGHHKRQVIGIGRGGRKVIWIEPYWRGPEDAPILVRPHKVDT